MEKSNLTIKKQLILTVPEKIIYNSRFCLLPAWNIPLVCAGNIPLVCARWIKKID